MSLLNKFILGFNFKERRKSLQLKNNSTLKCKDNQKVSQKQVLSQELVVILITFGFEFKQIVTAFKEYKFTNIDEACYVLVKDGETGKFNHRFISNEIFGIANYQNIDLCVICKGDATEHTDFDIESKMLVSGSNNFFSKKILFKSKTNLQRINLNMISDYNSNVKLKDNLNPEINLKIHNADLSSDISVYNQDKSIDKFFNLDRDKHNNYIGNSKINDNLEQLNKKTNQVDQIDNNDNIPKTKEKNILEDKSKSFNPSELVKPRKIPNVKIEIPPETIDLFDDPNVCRICFAEKMRENNRAEFDCGHMFCRKCVTRYLRYCIMNGKVFTFL